MKKLITDDMHKKWNKLLNGLEPRDKSSKLRSALDDLYFLERPESLRVFTKSPYYPIEKKV
jgi:hypothetical protein